MNLCFVIFGYLLGAIPFGLLIGKMAGKDVRQEGSKNIGATNVSRLLGKKLGLLTLLCDLLKGFVPMIIASTCIPAVDGKLLWVVSCGVAAVLGHMYPVYLGFRGGKGVATGLGVFIFLSPVATLISLVIFICSVYFTGFVSVGSLAASGLIPLWLWLLGKDVPVVTAAAVVAVFIWIKHYQNIGRLLRGEEKSWKKKKQAE